MPKPQSYARFVTKTFTPRPPSVAFEVETACVTEGVKDGAEDHVDARVEDRSVMARVAQDDSSGMFIAPSKLSAQMEMSLSAPSVANVKHDIDVPVTPPAPPALESGVFLAPDLAPGSDVTLIVYAWHNVQPGTLAWLFPTARAAVSAAYAMKNAVKWAVVRGGFSAECSDIDTARALGRVMIENC